MASTGTALRVAVIGSDPLARAGVVALLAGRPGLEVASEHAGASEALEAELTAAGAQVVVLIGPAAAGPGARAPSLPTVALVDSPEAAAQALAAGVRGVLARGTSAAQLAAAVTATAEGLVVGDPELTEPALQPAARTRAGSEGEPLTRRELEVLQLVAEGLSNRSIAARLRISEHTAKFHVNAILTKLGAAGRTDAVVRAARLGLLVL